MSVLAQHNSVTYISSKDAAQRVGYTSDYIARLAREGKIISRREGVQWLVELASLEMFLKAVEQAREERKRALREERLRERANHAATAVESQDSQYAQGVNQSHATAPVALSPLQATVISGSSATDEFPRGVGAHALAAGSLMAGLALAFVIVYGSTTVPVSKQTASLMDSFMHAARATWHFTLPWHKKEFAQVPVGPEQDLAHRGIVVLPSDSEDARTVAQVQESFSDDVIVRLDEDRTTGTIVPVFKDGPGDEYQFVIVPVAQPP